MPSTISPLTTTPPVSTRSSRSTVIAAAKKD